MSGDGPTIQSPPPGRISGSARGRHRLRAPQTGTRSDGVQARAAATATAATATQEGQAGGLAPGQAGPAGHCRGAQHQAGAGQVARRGRRRAGHREHGDRATAIRVRRSHRNLLPQNRQARGYRSAALGSGREGRRQRQEEGKEERHTHPNCTFRSRQTQRIRPGRRDLRGIHYWRGTGQTDRCRNRGTTRPGARGIASSSGGASACNHGSTGRARSRRSASARRATSLCTPAGSPPTAGSIRDGASPSGLPAATGLPAAIFGSASGRLSSSPCGRSFAAGLRGTRRRATVGGASAAGLCAACRTTATRRRTTAASLLAIPGCAP